MMSPRRLLMPLAKLYELGQALDRRRKLGQSYSGRLPVISIGALTVGGAGKTPMARWVIEALAGDRPILVLSRGYGREGEAEMVWHAGDPPPDPRLFGDEPALLARSIVRGGLAVGPDRARLLARIEAEFPGAVALLDDGFQHYGLTRALDVVMIDDRTLAHAYVVPAGDLREPLRGLARADVIVSGAGVVSTSLIERFARRGTPEFRCTAVTQGPFAWRDPAIAYGGQRPLLVSGIARPERFRASVAAACPALDLGGVEYLRFGDHQRYGPRELARIMGAMMRTGARVVITTGKDAVKLERFEELREVLYVLDYRFRLDDEARLVAILHEAIERTQT